MSTLPENNSKIKITKEIEYITDLSYNNLN